MYVPGTVLMWMAFILGAVSMVTYFLAVKDRQRWQTIARQAYVLMTGAVVVASGLLMYLLVTHDYRLSYVYAYSDNMLPTRYLISSFWGGQEGSFLLWIFAAVLFGLPVLRFAKGYETRVMFFYNLTILSLLLLLLKQDPFRFHEGLTADFLPMDGNGLNPLLQNPWMVIHPPVMFFGYASLGIPFAFALAALWMRRYDEWTKVSMPWVLSALVTLGTAIMMGGYWAYETLGWGGYWGWDPVENASLVPWLATAALTHGMLLQRGRKRFRRLNLVLAILAYLLVVYATFLTRSGVLGDFSVHSFVDLGISGWLVFNMLFFLLLSIGMLVYRWREIPAEEGEEPFMSRTIFMVLGVMMLILIGLVVLFGTSAPLLTRLWMESPAQVGPDFYNTLGYWLAVALALVLGATPFLVWHKIRKDAGSLMIRVIAVTTLVVAAAFFFGSRDWRSLVYFAAVAFCFVANSWAIIEKVRAGAVRRIGGELTHVGLGLMMLAFMTTGWFNADSRVRLEQGTPVEVLGYSMTFKGVDKPTPTARDAMVVDVVAPNGSTFNLRPLMWVNEKSNQLIANPDIKSTLTQDLYVAPVEYKPGDRAPVSGRMVLTKDEPAEFRDWTLLFKEFDLDAEHAIDSAMTVGVVVEIQRPGFEPVELKPTLISTEEGLKPVPVSIPDTPGGSLRAVGMAVDAGQVRVELTGLGGGIGRQAVLHKGETLAYQDLKITFDDFDLSDFDPEAGKINFGIVFLVEKDGVESEILVKHMQGPEGQPLVESGTVPGSGGIALSVGHISAEDGTVQLKIFDPFVSERPSKPASLVVDVSTKPLIALVWLGTLMMMAGISIAVFLRKKDLDAIE